MMQYFSRVIWLLITHALISVVNGLDVKIKSATCDNSLPITADLYMICNNGARCAFGDEVKLFGTMKYNNVANSGIQNNIGYISSSLELWTLNFHLFDMMPILLCDDTITASDGNENECPGDGSYDFALNYTLPSAGNEKTSWLASGWNGDGIIQIFAEADESMKIGECKLDLQTFVTRSASNETMLEFPSAAVTSGLLLAGLAFLALLTCYCYVCGCRRGARVNKYNEKPTEEVSYFKQMEDTKSTKTPRFSNKTKAKKSTAESESLVSDLM